MKKYTVVAMVSGLLLSFIACGGGDVEHEHGAVTLEIEFTPSPAQINQTVEIEIKAREGSELVMPEEVHVKINLRGSTDVTEIVATGHEDHFKAEQTFTTAGTYDITCEAHMDAEHGGVVEKTIQMEVQ